MCDISKKILTDENQRYCEIYKITNTNTNKIYVGQTVSHILNHGKYRPYGHKRRFNCHVSEAFSKKKKQCWYLNNSIKKHGKESFKVEIIEKCSINDADKLETKYIMKLNSLYPNGYNIKCGGKTFRHTQDSRKKVSDGVKKYFEDKKMKRFMKLKSIDDDIEKYIKPLNRKGKQYGWYIYINKIKADFGGVHTPIKKSKEEAINFLKILKSNLAKHLDAGNPLES